MALQFELDKIDDLDEGLKALYKEHNGKYRLSVEGIDPADELKEALRKEREEKSTFKTKLTEFEAAQQEAERKRMEEKQEFEGLYKSEVEAKGKLAKELEDLRTNIANEQRSTTALKVASSLTTDEKRGALIQKEAMAFIHHTPEGIKINGPDGQAWDMPKLTEYLKTEYPFLADGSQASGGGATGGNGGGATGKKFADYTGLELSKIRADNPQEYQRLLATK